MILIFLFIYFTNYIHKLEVISATLPIKENIKANTTQKQFCDKIDRIVTVYIFADFILRIITINIIYSLKRSSWDILIAFRTNYFERYLFTGFTSFTTKHLQLLYLVRKKFVSFRATPSVFLTHPLAILLSLYALRI